MDTIVIEKATTNDVLLLSSLGKETFYETFAAANTEKNMTKYLNENFSEERIGAELRNHDSLLFIAREGENAIGYLKLNFGNAQTEMHDKDALEIERIYVKSAYHGKKVGQLLYDKALEVATSGGHPCIWLGVWEENPKAIRFYEKNGFVAFDKHIFMMGEDAQTDIMMKKTI